MNKWFRNSFIYSFALVEFLKWACNWLFNLWSLEYLYINKQALNYLGSKQEDNKKVFEGLRYSSYFNVALSRWVLKAGITKHITFHCGRHTYATLLLSTNKVRLHTVSKLLGHKNIKTTQVYAKIMDKTKQDAVKQIPEIII